MFLIGNAKALRGAWYVRCMRSLDNFNRTISRIDKIKRMQILTDEGRRVSSIAQIPTSLPNARNLEHTSGLATRHSAGWRRRVKGGKKEEARSVDGGCRSLANAVVKLITPRNCLN
jgi:hypothetical protein